MKKQCVSLYAPLLLAAIIAVSASLRAQELSRPPSRAISFIENRGQIVDAGGRARPDVAYVAGGGGVNVYLRRNGISYVFAAYDGSARDGAAARESVPVLPADTVGLYRMDMELIGARDDVVIVPADTLAGYSNYYLAQCPHGITRVHRFGSLLYREVYRGIDMLIHSGSDGMKYDFIVHPGARVGDIRIRYHGADSIVRTSGGGLRATSVLGYVEDGRPYSFQSIENAASPQTLAQSAIQGDAGRRSALPVATAYHLESGVITFDVARYDTSRTLVIDPGLVWSTYLGGGDLFGIAMNYGQGIASDGNGGVFMTGYTTSAAFPTTVGAYQRTLRGSTDAFVVKFTSGGDTLWSTYYGGTRDETAYGIAADRTGNVLISGTTYSTADFPVLSAAQAAFGGGTTDAFVVKLDGSGARQWATYYGGSGNEDGYGIAVDSSREVLFTGGTTSANFPTLAPFQAARSGATDAFIVKLSPAGAKVWSTYFGGTTTQVARAIAIDSSRSVFVTGSTSSTNFPVAGRAVQRTASGLNDAFVVKLTSGGDTLWSTYYGGSDNDDGFGITTDGSGNVFVVGTTSSTNFPVTAAAFQRAKKTNRDAFAVKFAGNGDTLWSTYLGGDNIDYGRAVAVDRSQNVLVAGYTMSANFPVTSDAYRSTNSGDNDAFATKLRNATGDTLWSTYFGGNGADAALGIASDEGSNIYVTGYAASTTNFPIANAVQAARSNSLWDAFAAKFGCAFTPSIARSGTVNFCLGDSVVLSATPGASYLWSNGAASRSITVKTTGRYAVTVTDANGCIGTSDSVPVRVSSAVVPAIAANNATTICDGDSVRLTASAGYRHYLWSTAAADTLPVLTVKRAGTYTVTVTDSNGCRAMKDITIAVRPSPHPTVTPRGSATLCDGDSVVLDAPAGFTAYRWSNGAAGSSLVAARTGRYAVTVTDANGCTGTSDSILVTVRRKPVPTITPSSSTTLCRGDSVTLAAPAGFNRYLWSNGAVSPSIRIGDAGAYTVTVTDANGCTGVSAEIRVVVNDPPKPVITPSDSVTLCDGDSVVLAASGGFGTYRWSNNETTRGIAVRTAGSYSVVVTDINGCSGTATVAVRVLASPSAAISGPNSICPDRTASYSVPVTGGASYVWSVSGGTIVSGQGTSTIGVHWGGIGAGSVGVSATLAATGCARGAGMAISINNTLNPAIALSRSPILCDGDSIRLTAPAGYSTYTWSTGDTAASIVVRDTGSYTVSVADAGGCSGRSAPVYVARNVPARPVVTASGPLAICDGDSIVLAAPAGYADYRWSTGERGRAIAVKRPGDYTVLVTDSAGCSIASDRVAVSINPVPRPAIDGPNSVCTSRDARFQAVSAPGDSYTWSLANGTILSGQGTGAIVARWAATGRDTVMVTATGSATGCSGSMRYPIVIDSVLRPSIAGAASICPGDTIALAAASGYDSYRWSNGDSTQATRVWMPGSYSVDVADAGGCRGRSDDWIVTASPAPTPSITPGGIIALCPAESITLDAGGGYASYRWSTGDSSQTITVRSAGRYSVTVTNAAGCTGASPEVTVELRAAPPMPAIAQLGDTLVASPALAYQWQLDGAPIAGAIAQRHVFTKLGSYTVVIRDSNGCAATSAPIMPEGGATASVILTAIEAAPGEHIFLPIVLGASRNLDQSGASNFSATLRFNGTLLVPAGATPVGSLKDGERSIPIAGVRPAGMSFGELMRLEFIAALGDAESTPVALDSFAWAGAPPVQSAITAGVFRLQGLCRSGNTRLVDATGSIALKASRPNPTGGPTTIEYETVEQGRTRLVVSDLLGRTVAVLLDEELAPGRYVVSFDASRVPSGTYVYTLQTPTAKLARAMVVGR